MSPTREDLVGQPFRSMMYCTVWSNRQLTCYPTVVADDGHSAWTPYVIQVRGKQS